MEKAGWRRKGGEVKREVWREREWGVQIREGIRMAYGVRVDRKGGEGGGRKERREESGFRTGREHGEKKRREGLRYL